MPDERSLLRLIIGAAEMMDCAVRLIKPHSAGLYHVQNWSQWDPQEKEKQKERKKNEKRKRERKETRKAPKHSLFATLNPAD